MVHKIINKDKPEINQILGKNAESSASIPLGSPVVFVMNGTDDGLAVVLPATAGALKTASLQAGVALEAMSAGAVGKLQNFGFCRQAAMIVRTRSASDANWASVAAKSVGQKLKIDTVNNAFDVFTPDVTLTDVTGTAASDTITRALAFNGFAPIADLCEDLASSTTVASNATNAWSAASSSTALVKVFLRML